MSKLAIGLCVFVMLAITPSVHADPIVITSGSLTVTGIFGSPSYSFSGQNFSVTATPGDPGNTPNCLPCPSGTPVNISSFLAGSSLGQGSATINGMTFNNLFFSGVFSLAAENVVLPVGTTNITVTAPFFFSGFIQGCEGNSLDCVTQVFGNTDLVGQGIATANFTFSETVNGVSLYNFRSVTYQFQEIPEPMTALLLASGLIGLGAKLKARSKRRSA